MGHRTAGDGSSEAVVRTLRMEGSLGSGNGPLCKQGILTGVGILTLLRRGLLYATVLASVKIHIAGKSTGS